MKTVIYGAGAIGGTIGGHLALAGHEVALIGRPRHVEAIRAHGLRLVTPSGTHDLRLPAFTSPQEAGLQPEDPILLCVKGQDTEGALRDLQAAAPDVPVFCVQNGVRNEEAAAQRAARVYGVMVRVGGVHLQPGKVIARRDPPGTLVLGRYPNGTDATVEAVAGQLREAGFLVLVSPDVMAYKYGKLLANLANAVGAITNAGGRDADYRQIVEAAEQEARSLLAQAGIAWVSDEQLAQEVPGLDGPARGQVEVEAGNSTWQSLARGQGSVETEYLNGEIVRLAGELNAEAPVNTALTRIALEMAARQERPGKHTPAELRALLGV